MPFTRETPDGWKRDFRRVLINGAPLSGKTTSLKTWPAKRHVVIAPGELGHSSLLPDADTEKYFWEFDPAQPKIAWSDIYREFKTLITEIAKGEHGECTTLAVDGLHRLYYTIQMANGYNPDNDAKQFMKFHKEFGDIMALILGSKIPYIVCTVYDGKEPVEGQKGVTQIFPGLPGMMAKDIMGLFPVVMHSVREPDTERKGKTKRYWQLQPSGNMQGAGLHVPIEFAERFPAELPQDWGHMEKLIAEATAT